MNINYCLASSNNKTALFPLCGSFLASTDHLCITSWYYACYVPHFSVHSAGS